MEKGLQITIVIAIAVILAGGGYYLLTMNGDGDTTNDRNTSQLDTDTSADTSQLSDLPDNSTTQSVSLVDQGVSFFVEKDVEEVSSLQVYKRYANPNDCLYTGQKANKELVVVAFEDGTGSECLSRTEFEMTGNRTAGEYELNVAELMGNKDNLKLETVKLGNNVSMAFFYKEKFDNNVQPEIAEILESFEIEIAQ